ncbi:hypothetical protein C3L33_23288, partial [Rhododendron williamsianum]
MFLRLLCLETNLPVLGLMDCDPYGLKILSVYKYGSIDMAYDSNHLTTPGILWLGLRQSDLETYHLPQDVYTDLVDDDRTAASSLLQLPFMDLNPNWVSEIKMMLNTNRKVELDSLCMLGFGYLSEQYLPNKILFLARHYYEVVGEELGVSRLVMEEADEVEEEAAAEGHGQGHEA